MMEQTVFEIDSDTLQDLAEDKEKAQQILTKAALLAQATDEDGIERRVADDEDYTIGWIVVKPCLSEC